MGAEAVFCGDNFFFGKNRSGNVEVLEELCKKYNIVFRRVDTVMLDGEMVSSTSVRNALVDGDIEKANKLLGRPYSVCFEVIHGKQLGRTIGTPTINQVYPDSMCSPKLGVYITCTTVDGVKYPSATGFGSRPTVNGDGMNITCETYIRDFSGDLYGREIQVDFYKYLFPSQKFSSLDELVSMIHGAADESEKLLAGLNIIDKK